MAVEPPIAKFASPVAFFEMLSVAVRKSAAMALTDLSLFTASRRYPWKALRPGVPRQGSQLCNTIINLCN